MKRQYINNTINDNLIIKNIYQRQLNLKKFGHKNHYEDFIFYLNIKSKKLSCNGGSVV